MTMGQQGWQASAEALAQVHRRADINYDESRVGAYELPDVLSDGHGGRVTDEAGWRRRREEILELFRREEYGRSPAVPSGMWFEEVLRDGSALGGAATLKLVDIHLGREAGAPSIRLQVFVPNGRRGPAPAFLLICNRDKSNIDVTRRVRSEFWPVEELVSRGFAASSFHYEDMAPDHRDSFGEPAYSYFGRPEERDGESWGALSAWAWAASRCLDYFETDGDIDARRCAVTGHSRGGKTALWCGAQDERWAMVVSSCSGCSGASLSRRNYGETLAAITGTFDYWFCGNYRRYVGHESELPFDQHWLLALIAPRALYVHSAGDDLWADPRGEWLSLQAAAPVWRLLGRGGLPEGQTGMPALDQRVWGDGMAYHIRPGEHNNKLVDWLRHAEFFAGELGRS